MRVAPGKQPFRTDIQALRGLAVLRRRHLSYGDSLLLAGACAWMH